MSTCENAPLCSEPHGHKGQCRYLAANIVQIGWAWRYVDLSNPSHDPNWHYLDGTERPAAERPYDLSNGYHTQLVPVFANSLVVAERRPDRAPSQRAPSDELAPDQQRDIRPEIP